LKDFQTVVNELNHLKQIDPEMKLPLHGVPYAVKDNIDVKGLPTTAACSEYQYFAENNSPIIEQLNQLGAICLGKSNMDQFATGLVGTRSPYGIVKNSFDQEYISGGSSSGSAVAVSLGLVSFSLGTDTAGSGRVPAAFNDLFGYKPTKDLISTQFTVPACKSLDCISIFTSTNEDTKFLTELLIPKFNTLKKKIKKTLAIPSEKYLEFFSNTHYQNSFNHLKISLIEQGWNIKEIDFSIFKEVAAMLYHGPWVAERYASVKSFIEKKPDAPLTLITQILQQAHNFSAIDYFVFRDKLESLKSIAWEILNQVDALLTPTAPTIFKIQEVLEDPIQKNTQLGYYTNFVNLLELCAYSIPIKFTNENSPFGVTLIANKNLDNTLLDLADDIRESLYSKEYI